MNFWHNGLSVLGTLLYVYLVAWIPPPYMYLFALIVGYASGSIPFSYLIPRQFYGVDIREQGSGNIGATNVARTLGPLPGTVCFVLDLAKGALPVGFAMWLASVNCDNFVHPPSKQVVLHCGHIWYLPVMAAIGAILGHSKPIWLHFRGGKGVATGLGAVLALNPLVGAASFITWLGVLALTRIVSVASIAAALALPGFMLALPNPLFGTPNPDLFVWFSVAAGLFIILRHHDSIRRLVAGTERRVGHARNNSSTSPEGAHRDD